MRTIATRDAGYSPLLRDTVTAGREYDLPDADPVPEFLAPAAGQQNQPESPWTYTDTSEETHGGTE